MIMRKSMIIVAFINTIVCFFTVFLLNNLYTYRKESWNDLYWKNGWVAGILVLSFLLACISFYIVIRGEKDEK